MILAGPAAPAWALAPQADAALTGILMLATAVWIGGLVAIFVVARVARRTLQPAERVQLFRGLGRVYGRLGGLALAAALMSGAALLSGHPWNGLVTAATAVAGGLVALTVAGVLQARRMTRLRRSALGHPGNPQLAAQVRREAVSAAILRALIAALSLALLALGAVLAG